MDGRDASRSMCVPGRDRSGAMLHLRGCILLLIFSPVSRCFSTMPAVHCCHKKQGSECGRGRRGEFNHRFAQPSQQSAPGFGHLFPFADNPTTDPLTNQTERMWKTLYRHVGSATMRPWTHSCRAGGRLFSPVAYRKGAANTSSTTRDTISTVVEP